MSRLLVIMEAYISYYHVEETTTTNNWKRKKQHQSQRQLLQCTLFVVVRWCQLVDLLSLLFTCSSSNPSDLSFSYNECSSSPWQPPRNFLFEFSTIETSPKSSEGSTTMVLSRTCLGGFSTWHSQDWFTRWYIWSVSLLIVVCVEIAILLLWYSNNTSIHEYIHHSASGWLPSSGNFNWTRWKGRTRLY